MPAIRAGAPPESIIDGSRLVPRHLQHVRARRGGSPIRPDVRTLVRVQDAVDGSAASGGDVPRDSRLTTRGTDLAFPWRPHSGHHLPFKIGIYHSEPHLTQIADIGEINFEVAASGVEARMRPSIRRQLALTFRMHGGKRKGAGRPCKGARPGERHKARPAHNRRHPVHVTMRVVDDVTTLRQDDVYMQLREATIVTSKRTDFRIVHMSIQWNHIHMIVEADDKQALSRGVQGFSISAAKRVNATITERTGVRRRGRVIEDRFHARVLTSPRAVRHAIAYVLGNWRHHREDERWALRRTSVDPFSSGLQFSHWKELAHSPVLFPIPAAHYPLIVYRPRTWLLSTGWHQHHPLISVREVPGR